MEIIPLVLLALVLLGIALRGVLGIPLKIWEIMSLGALIAVLTGTISVPDALKAINLDVILFLFGMFYIGEAMVSSGYLYHAAWKIFRRSTSVDLLVLAILFFLGGLSAILMNDTVVIIATPLMLHFARSFNLKPKFLLITLMLAVTTGSVLSPIGNPQNLLIAVDGGLKSPFATFFVYLFVPTTISLGLAYLLIKVRYRREFHPHPLEHGEHVPGNRRLATLCKVSLVLIFLSIAAKVIIVELRVPFDFRLTYIALLGAVPIAVGSRERVRIARKIDWSTLVFFVSLFILMRSVWDTGFFQNIPFVANQGNHVGISTVSRPSLVSMILGVSAVISQIVSNVPFIAIWLPVMKAAGSLNPLTCAALAAGSTLAGNMLLLGAASNVIVVQNAEREGETVRFGEFAAIGIPLTLLQLTVYWGWLSFVSFLAG